jgi:hypothetical protein
MSDNWIILIPSLVSYVPSEEEQKKAIAFFRTLAPRADEIQAEVSAEARFIDCGANLHDIICPNCGRKISLEWWQAQMEKEYATGFPMKALALPCCKVERSLTELKYDWPQGFARFSLEAMNPDIGRFSDDSKCEFEKILGCELQVIYRHL